MIVFNASTPQILRDEIVRYFNFLLDREYDLVSQRYDSTQRDRHGRQWRINLLKQLQNEFSEAKLLDNPPSI